MALAALTRHDTSEGELRAKLLARGLDEDDVEAELDRLKGAGLWTTRRSPTASSVLRERKGLGDGDLRPALRARQLPQAVIDAALAATPRTTRPATSGCRRSRTTAPGGSRRCPTTSPSAG